MEQEFERQPGNVAISKRGFTVKVQGGMAASVEYTEPGKQVLISAELLTTGGIGLFMNWVKFPDGSSEEEKRQIFEGVIRALWFLEIAVGDVEIHPHENKWPLPPRPARSPAS